MACEYQILPEEASLCNLKVNNTLFVGWIINSICVLLLNQQLIESEELKLKLNCFQQDAFFFNFSRVFNPVFFLFLYTMIL